MYYTCYIGKLGISHFGQWGVPNFVMAASNHIVAAFQGAGNTMTSAWDSELIYLSDLSYCIPMETRKLCCQPAVKCCLIGRSWDARQPIPLIIVKLLVPDAPWCLRCDTYDHGGDKVLTGMRHGFVTLPEMPSGVLTAVPCRSGLCGSYLREPPTKNYTNFFPAAIRLIERFRVASGLRLSVKHLLYHVYTSYCLRGICITSLGHRGMNSP